MDSKDRKGFWAMQGHKVFRDRKRPLARKGGKVRKETAGFRAVLVHKVFLVRFKAQKGFRVSMGRKVWLVHKETLDHKVDLDWMVRKDTKQIGESKEGLDRKATPVHKVRELDRKARAEHKGPMVHKETKEQLGFKAQQELKGFQRHKVHKASPGQMGYLAHLGFKAMLGFKDSVGFRVRTLKKVRLGCLVWRDRKASMEHRVRVVCKALPVRKG